MKIYYLLNKQTSSLNGLVFNGLVTMDIGFKSYGITIVNSKGNFKTIDLKPFDDSIKLAKLGIPEYVLLSSRVSEILLNMIQKNPKLKNYIWSMEIPNIMGSFSTALSILLTSVTLSLLNIGVPAIMFTGNRLGGFYLKKRSYTKTEIKNLVKKNFDITYKISDHECDSLLAAYSIYLGVFGKNLKDVQLRPFELELQDITYRTKK